MSYTNVFVAEKGLFEGFGTAMAEYFAYWYFYFFA